MVDSTKKPIAQKSPSPIEPLELYESLDRAVDKGPLRPARHNARRRRPARDEARAVLGHPDEAVDLLDDLEGDGVGSPPAGPEQDGERLRTLVERAENALGLFDGLLVGRGDSPAEHDTGESRMRAHRRLGVVQRVCDDDGATERLELADDLDHAARDRGVQLRATLDDQDGKVGDQGSGHRGLVRGRSGWVLPLQKRMLVFSMNWAQTSSLPKKSLAPLSGISVAATADIIR